MAVNEMGHRGSWVRKEKALWRRTECLGNWAESLNCKGRGYMGRSPSGEGGRNHIPEDHPPEPLELVVPAFTPRREASAPWMHPRTLPVHWPFHPSQPQAERASPPAHLGLISPASLSPSTLPSPGAVGVLGLAVSLAACSSGALPLLPSLFSPWILSMCILWAFFLPPCLLPPPEALFRGLDPLNVGVGLASVLILSSLGISPHSRHSSRFL